MTLDERIQAAIADFSALHPDWDVTIVERSVAPSRRGRGPGWSVYVLTADGVGFEVVLLAGDHVAEALGAAEH